MKQIITTAIATLCIIFNAEAQGTFKTLHFIRNEMVSDGIGGEYAHVSSSGNLTGTIDIDTKDSIIRIQTGTPGGYGAQLKTYKFNLIDPEKTYIYDDGVKLMVVKLHGINAKGIPYIGRFARQVEKGKKEIMDFSINYDEKNVETFVCDYEKDIYK